MAEHDKPATLTGYWQPTGRTRIRSGWFGLLVIEVQQARVAMAGIACTTQTRWRRAPRDQVVTFGQGSAAMRAYVAGMVERCSRQGLNRG